MPKQCALMSDKNIFRDSLSEILPFSDCRSTTQVVWKSHHSAFVCFGCFIELLRRLCKRLESIPRVRLRLWHWRCHCTAFTREMLLNAQSRNPAHRSLNPLVRVQTPIQKSQRRIRPPDVPS